MTDWEKVKKIQAEYNKQLKDLLDDIGGSGKALNPKLTGANYHLTRMKVDQKKVVSLILQSWN